MRRYAVIEQSTDLRYPQTKIWFTRSLRGIAKLLERSGRFSYSDPEAARNWHRTFVKAYELPVGWRKPTEKQLREKAVKESTSTYPRNSMDILAWIIREVGVEVKFDERGALKQDKERTAKR